VSKVDRIPKPDAHLVKDLASERPNPPSLLENTIKIMTPAVAVATSAPPAAPFVLPAAAAVALASWSMENTEELRKSSDI